MFLMEILSHVVFCCFRRNILSHSLLAKFILKAQFSIIFEQQVNSNKSRKEELSSLGVFH